MAPQAPGQDVRLGVVVRVLPLIDLLFLREVQQLVRGAAEVVLSKDLDLHLIPARVEVRISRRKFMGEKNAF